MYRHFIRTPRFLSFAINLQCGPLMNPMDDLALHFNPRFHEKHVVRNTLLSGHWGHEEHHGHFPFHHEQGFEVLILAESNEYKVFYLPFYQRKT